MTFHFTAGVIYEQYEYVAYGRKMKQSVVYFLHPVVILPCACMPPTNTRPVNIIKIFDVNY